MTVLNLETKRFFLRPLEKSDHSDPLELFGDAVGDGVSESAESESADDSVCD